MEIINENDTEKCILKEDLRYSSLYLFEFEIEQKLIDFEGYLLSPYSNVPPGDCIIIEFSEEKDFTDKMCDTYRQSIQKGDMVGG